MVRSLLTNDTKELFVMIAEPKQKEKSAIQLTQDIWKIEEELDMLYSSAESSYKSYGEEGESGILLKTDGTLIIRFPSEKTCLKKFEAINKKIVASKTLAQMRYEKPKLKKYKVTKKIEGKLEEIIPKALIDFLRNPKHKCKYDPEHIVFEFLDSQTSKNFVRIIFDRVDNTNNLLLDVTVESNDVEYAKATIKKLETLLKK
jgi:hypothetical protein